MPPDSVSDEDAFLAERPRLTGLAYRMLGSLAEAEDAVQEVFLRWRAGRPAELREAAAWLTTVTTRVCLDHLRSARVRRESYVGPWLPEPVDAAAIDPAGDPFETAARRQDLSLALLLALEALSPAERAAFLLHDVFDYGFAEIAGTLETTEANCRQLASRARRKLRAERPMPQAPLEQLDRLYDRFEAACSSRDPRALLELLEPDAELLSDGGGKVAAALNPIRGADRVVRFMMGIAGKAPPGAQAFRQVLNGAPALTVYVDGALFVSFHLDAAAGGRIRRILAVSNPDKLRHVPRPGNSARHDRSHRAWHC